MLFTVMLAALEEDERSLAELIYIKYKRQIYKIAYSILNNHHDAEDVLNDVVLNVINNIEKFVDSDGNKTAAQIVIYSRNAAINRYNKNKRKSEAESSVSYMDEDGTLNNVDIPDSDANLEEITIEPEQEVSIAQLRFTSAQKTTVKLLHEFIFDMLSDISSDCSYEIRYYLDEELLPYKPYERVGGIYGSQSGTSEVSICRDFFYVLKDVEPNITHTWDVRVITHGIDQTVIGVNNAHITLEGQRMYGEDYFDGFIEARDNITIVPCGSLSLLSITENIIIDLRNATIGTATDNLGIYDVSTMSPVPIAEGSGTLSPHVFFETIFGHIQTEDGDNLTTESGDRLIL